MIKATIITFFLLTIQPIQAFTQKPYYAGTQNTITCPCAQAHAYDVIYRHALALDDSGNRLAIGSTTGGLWVSENQGDRWACVTHTLPPVYAVTFA